MENKKAVFVLGLKWFDKVNGNTYNNPTATYMPTNKGYLIAFLSVSLLRYA